MEEHRTRNRIFDLLGHLEQGLCADLNEANLTTLNQEEERFSFRKLRGLFWYPRLGWVPLFKCGTQPNIVYFVYEKGKKQCGSDSGKCGKILLIFQMQWSVDAGCSLKEHAATRTGQWQTS
ncbi:hypothetical protein AVEN_11064-1 [Araneus ventricosus]|uniref:Uncharacterized protein n=1 Tax=Araneus ventricosus TaxID=182803 RepID=A0A4Y2WFF7_ARAVE|nr:hypothetical protein AVEN_11064-1 [Araneus ventricosus]